MKNWGYVRQNIKLNAKKMIASNLRLCILAGLLFVLANVLIDWISGMIASTEVVLDTLHPLHSVVEAYLTLSPQEIAVTVLLNLAAVLLTAPLEVGTAAFYLDVSGGRDITAMRLKDVLRWYTELRLSLKAFAVLLLKRVLLLVWMALFCALPLCLMYINENNITGSDLTLVDTQLLSTSLVLAIMLVAAAALATVRWFSYMPLTYLLSADPARGAFPLVRVSSRLMRGRVFEYAVFELSFIGWYLAVVATFGLALIYLIPYRQACLALFYRSLSDSGG